MLPNKMKLLALVLLFALQGMLNIVYAQNDEQKVAEENLLEMSLEELLNIKISSSSKVEQAQAEAPNIVAVISKKVSNDFGLTSLNQILYVQPGYFHSQDYERNTSGFRGMFEGWNNNHLLMLIDGIPFNDNLYGTAYTWEISPLTFSNSVEVIFGPGGALYGNNAMNGVVTINSSEVRDIEGIARSTMRFGSNNYAYFDVLTGVENDLFGIVSSFTYYNTDGNEYLSFDASDRVDGTGNPKKFRTNDSRNGSYFFTKLYGKNKYEGLTFQYHEQQWEFQTGHGWLFIIPDRPEDMKEYRRIFALRYAPSNKSNLFDYELTSRFQIHEINWNMRYFDNGGWSGYYPDGVSEYLKTDAKDLFLRAQLAYKPNRHNLIFGVEGNSFFYNGDKIHYSNIDMNTWADPSTQTYFELNPWLEFVKDQPTYNLASFFQYMSPKFMEKIQLTGSIRYDRMFFDFYDVSTTGRPLKSKNFDMLTPRLALVYQASKNIVIKAIYNKAFRTPSPTEMFGYNTYTLASNINQLKPEKLSNYDLGIVWTPISKINFRVNGFWINFENQIAYSTTNANLSTNVYSLKTAGGEMVLQFISKGFSAFANASYAKRIEEKILDSTISTSNKITWAPSTLFKFGALYYLNKFTFSATGIYQSKEYRRESDKYSGMEQYRPLNYIDAWLSIDMKVSYRINKKVELAFLVNNILNSERYLIKSGAYAYNGNPYRFDYQMEGRRIFGEFTIKF